MHNSAVSAADARRHPDEVIGTPGTPWPDGGVGDDPLFAVFVEEAEDQTGRLEGALLAMEAGPAAPDCINQALRVAHTLKGNSALVGLSGISDLCHALEDVMVCVRDGRVRCDHATAGTLLSAVDVLRGQLAALRGVPADSGAYGRVLQSLAGLAVATAAPPSGPPGSDAIPGGGPALSQQAAQDASTMRITAAKVDKLVDLAGELAVAQSVVAQLVAQFSLDKLSLLQDAVAQMERHARDLQERVLAIRMLPIRTVFSRFPRLVRDLGIRCGKRVVLVTSGEDTEVDKSVIEQLADPLVHLVRNAIDHGIESPDARRAAKKPEQGTVTMAAYQQGGSIFIDVGDDGCGLDCEGLVRRAVAAGLVAAEDALGAEEAMELIFHPGLSTAAEVTDVSGRGVGMDVVKRNVSTLGGSIAVHSRPGVGTRFRIVLPLTLVMLDGQLLQVGDQVYVLPLVNIVESLRPRAEQVTTVMGGNEVLTLRGETIPIVRLHVVLDADGAETDPTRGLLVVAEGSRGRVALLVDHLLEQHQVVIKSIEANFRHIDGVAGATILGDGRVALILDVPGLTRLSRDGARPSDGMPGSGRPMEDTDAGGIVSRRSSCKEDSVR